MKIQLGKEKAKRKKLNNLDVNYQYPINLPE